jgi:hypothetical protein
VGPRAGLDGHGKSRPPSEFDPRTVQPVASRYTGCSVPPHMVPLKVLKLRFALRKLLLFGA